jgi:hypothetical protein
VFALPTMWLVMLGGGDVSERSSAMGAVGSGDNSTCMAICGQRCVFSACMFFHGHGELHVKFGSRTLHAERWH